MRADTIVHTFLRQVQKHGDKTALREKEFGVWKEISWNGYARHVRHFCLGLMELGLNRGDHISILGENKPEWLYADLAVQSAGGVGVGVYPTNPAPEAKYVIGHSDSVFVVCGDQEQVDKILEVKDELPLLKKIIVVDMKGLRNYREPLIVSFAEVEALGRKRDEEEPGYYQSLVDRVDPRDVAIMVYTSGTTGPPKGAMLLHDNVIRFLTALSQAIPEYDTDEIVSYLPLCHVAERMMTVGFPLYSGATVNFAESVDTVSMAMREILPTVFFAVPRIWEKMMAAVTIKMKDASWLKRKIYHYFLPVGRRMAEARLAGRRPSFSLYILHGLGYLTLFRAFKKGNGPAADQGGHERRRGHCPGSA